MMVRREIAEPPCETAARSPGDRLRHLRRCLSRCASEGDSGQTEGRQSLILRRGSEGRARWPEAFRSSESAIVAEAFMGNAD